LQSGNSKNVEYFPEIAVVHEMSIRSRTGRSLARIQPSRSFFLQRGEGDAAHDSRWPRHFTRASFAFTWHGTNLEGIRIADLGAEPELVSDVILGIAVVVDMDLDATVSSKLWKLGPPAGQLARRNSSPRKNGFRARSARRLGEVVFGRHNEQHAATFLGPTETVDAARDEIIYDHATRKNTQHVLVASCSPRSRIPSWMNLSLL
jgi:hypothetical protein